MPTTTLRRALALSLAVAVLSAACGDDDDDDDDEASTDTSSDETTTSATDDPPGSTTSTTVAPTTDGGGGTDMDATISLDVEITADGQMLRRGSLTCGDTASGSDFFADPATAEAACALLRDDAEARRLLVDGPDPNLLCTEMYGGPEVARVRGEIDGQAVDATVDRVNGCGIAAWDTLGALFGPADT
ncbi:MAG: hypothetical protein ACRD2C_15905 [Acidimicrobiales bacterium]